MDQEVNFNEPEAQVSLKSITLLPTVDESIQRDKDPLGKRDETD